MTKPIEPDQVVAAREKYGQDTLESLVRELLDDPDFKPGPSYQFRECPFCGQWISNGSDHAEGHAIGMSGGPIFCWLVRAAWVLGIKPPRGRRETDLNTKSKRGRTEVGSLDGKGVVEELESPIVDGYRKDPCGCHRTLCSTHALEFVGMHEEDETERV